MSYVSARVESVSVEEKLLSTPLNMRAGKMFDPMMEEISYKASCCMYYAERLELHCLWTDNSSSHAVICDLRPSWVMSP